MKCLLLCLVWMSVLVQISWSELQIATDPNLQKKFDIMKKMLADLRSRCTAFGEDKKLQQNAMSPNSSKTEVKIEQSKISNDRLEKMENAIQKLTEELNSQKKITAALNRELIIEKRLAATTRTNLNMQKRITAKIRSDLNSQILQTRQFEKELTQQNQRSTDISKMRSDLNSLILQTRQHEKEILEQNQLTTNLDQIKSDLNYHIMKTLQLEEQMDQQKSQTYNLSIEIQQLSNMKKENGVSSTESNSKQRMCIPVVCQNQSMEASVRNLTTFRSNIFQNYSKLINKVDAGVDKNTQDILSLLSIVTDMLNIQNNFSSEIQGLGALSRAHKNNILSLRSMSQINTKKISQIMQITTNAVAAQNINTQNMQQIHARLDRLQLQLKQLPVKQLGERGQGRNIRHLQAAQADVAQELQNLMVRTEQLEQEMKKYNKKRHKVAFSALFGPFTRQYVRFGQTVIYDVVSYNQGSGYNERTGHFICPASGVYAFFASVYISDGSNPLFKIASKSSLVSETSKTLAWVAGANGSIMTVTRLQKGDIVRVVCQYSQSGIQLREQSNTFSGYLIYPL